jgi:hypothetical protein
MKPEMKGKLQYGVIGLIGGAVIAIIIGFAGGSWVTASESKKVCEEAILANNTAICVAQFMGDPNYQAKLKEIEKVDSWKRFEFITSGGWDKMPGQKESSTGVANLCATKIEELIKK